MTKSVRKLQAEIDRALKQVDEVSPPPDASRVQGICSLNQLEVRLENANSLQMKEKIETEIKKEIKKLQRHRDFFKQLMKDSEVKDKTKITEARHRIEEQMEKFRELEKEYKQKKLTKVSYQTHNEIESKYIDHDQNDSSDQDNYSSDPDSADGSASPLSEPDTAPRPSSPELPEEADASIQPPSSSDKDWFNMLFVSSLKEISSKIEGQIAAIRQEKSKKKNKQQVVSMLLRPLEQRLQTNNVLASKVAEIQPILELVDSQRIRKVQVLATAYIRASGEHDHTPLATELELVIQ